MELRSQPRPSWTPGLCLALSPHPSRCSALTGPHLCPHLPTCALLQADRTSSSPIQGVCGALSPAGPRGSAASAPPRRLAPRSGHCPTLQSSSCAGLTPRPPGFSNSLGSPPAQPSGAPRAQTKLPPPNSASLCPSMRPLWGPFLPPRVAGLTVPVGQFHGRGFRQSLLQRRRKTWEPDTSGRQHPQGLWEAVVLPGPGLDPHAGQREAEECPGFSILQPQTPAGAHPWPNQTERLLERTLGTRPVGVRAGGGEWPGGTQVGFQPAPALPLPAKPRA